MSLASMRLAAIAITALLAIAVRDSIAWQSAVLSIGFGHYLLSVWYARSKLAIVATHWSTAVPMAAAVVIGSVLYIGRFPLIIYFAAHHVFNEVYLTGEKLKGLNANQVRLYRATAIPLQTFLYFYLLRSELNIRYLQDSVLLAALVVTYVCYLMLLLSLRKSIAVRSLLELASFEIAGFVVLAASFITPIRFLDVVCYHFVFWWFYPATKMAARGMGVVLTYAVQMTILIGIAFLLSPAGLIGDYPFRNSVYMQQFILWSHIHITSSFFLSSAHPAWITRWFTVRSSEVPSTSKRISQQASPQA
jgi:hypothetical protein